MSKQAPRAGLRLAAEAIAHSDASEGRKRSQPEVSGAWDPEALTRSAAYEFASRQRRFGSADPVRELTSHLDSVATKPWSTPLASSYSPQARRPFALRPSTSEATPEASSAAFGSLSEENSPL
jgi:hypothetical protein